MINYKSTHNRLGSTDLFLNDHGFDKQNKTSFTELFPFIKILKKYCTRSNKPVKYPIG